VVFISAKPVWLAGRETEVHLRVQFKATVPAADEATIYIATSGVYHLYVNGEFLAYGPARAGKGYFRVDEISLNGRLNTAENVVVLEVCGYNSSSFSIINQPSFVQAEILSGNKVLAATGTDFTARVHPFLYRKTQRYSYQRPQVEAYHIDYMDSFLTDRNSGTEPIAETEPKKLTKRRSPYPCYERVKAEPISSGGVENINPEICFRDRSWESWEGTVPTAFPIPELDVFATDEYQRMKFIPSDTCFGGSLTKNGYSVYRFPYETTGMLTCRVTCETPITLYFFFDEILTDGLVDALRMRCANAIRYDLCAGTHDLQVFEVYSMTYVQVVALNGGCTVEDLSMIEYKHPPVTVPFIVPTPNLQKIVDAAVETFRQNSVDLFTDCPSRERAGWLCDSFWIARVAYLLTGSTAVETDFLENFLHEEQVEGLPEGMLPMCYPADHVDGNYIPQWPLWLILQLREYRGRGGDAELIEQYRPRVYKLLEYFYKHENEDGLLENLGGWNFIEWSHANDLVQDVNYPTNMLYAGALRAVADLYADDALLEKAEKVARTVRRQSFDGNFFVDNAIRQNGKLVLSGERTEVCQYYAFFFDIATPETHGELFKVLLDDFGPGRQMAGKWPEIWPANAFVGNYMRLEILLRYGFKKVLLDNIEGYFLYMAEQTGTLWENVTSTASCNHGFASHVLVWLDALNKHSE